MKNITPTVGRIVYFNPGRRAMPPYFSPPADDQPLAAIVAAVLGGGSLLVLSVIDSGGQQYGLGPVRLVQEGEDIPDDGCYAYWMPYQLHQAGIKHLDEQKPAAAAPAPVPGAAPKVEQVRIDALVASLTYETAHVPNTTSTVATARLPGGFVVAIGHSACVAPENFDAEKGRTYAIADAESKARAALWSFEGYALYLRLEQLRAAGVADMPAHQQRVVLEKIELDEKIAKLVAFIETQDEPGSIYSKLPLDEQARLESQMRYMQEYSAILSHRIAAF